MKSIKKQKLSLEKQYEKRLPSCCFRRKQSKRKRKICKRYTSSNSTDGISPNAKSRTSTSKRRDYYETGGSRESET
jgi:hypothetical protein